MAKILDVDSVSIPAISSGVLNFPKDKCAEIMIKRVAQWFALQKEEADKLERDFKIEAQEALNQVTRLRKVRLCNLDDDTVGVFVKELNKV